MVVHCVFVVQKGLNHIKTIHYYYYLMIYNCVIISKSVWPLELNDCYRWGWLSVEHWKSNNHSCFVCVCVSADRGQWWGLLGAVLVRERHLRSGCLHPYSCSWDTSVTRRVTIKSCNFMLQGCWKTCASCRKWLPFTNWTTNRYAIC